jgi:two-component system cell cycle sensor histidine kinase/response regulator CckA
MPQGGTLTIETANAVLDEAYAHQHLDVEPGEYVMLSVSDTGTGMDDEVKRRLFEPFFTTKEKGKGTGLGLATVFGVVKQNEGHIWVHSEVGQGTTFQVYLPRTEHVETRPPEPAQAPLPSGPTPARETLLLVENEADVRVLAAHILDSQGYRILAAANGSEALRLSGEYDGPIHLLLTDVVMPQMSGPEVAEQLSAQRPEMRVLYMSGYADEAAVQRVRSTRRVPFLPKPFGADQLLLKVRAMLDGQTQTERK